MLTLDLGGRSGWADGPAGDLPRSGFVWVRKKTQPLEVGPANLGCWLRDRLRLARYDLVAIEDFLNPAAQRSPEAAISALRLDGAVRAVAGCYGVRVVAVNNATHRK